MRRYQLYKGLEQVWGQSDHPVAQKMIWRGKIGTSQENRLFLRFCDVNFFFGPLSDQINPKLAPDLYIVDICAFLEGIFEIFIFGRILRSKSQNVSHFLTF